MERVVVAVVVLAFFAAFLRTCGPAAETTDVDELVLVGRVIKIVDGDTIDVALDSGPIRIRMQGIDAPERGQPMSGDATELLRDLVDEKEVELLPSGQYSFERMIARVYLGETDVNAEMIRRGLAMAERRFLREFDDGESYCEFEHDARSARLGIWALPPGERTAPWEWRRRKDREAFTDYGAETVAGCVAAIP